MKKIFLTKRGPTSPRRTSRGGFTAFFAVLVASLALSVGLAIYDLLIRQLTLSQVATQSVYAIFAADTAIECALYWDNKASSLNGSPSIFATSSASGNAVFSGTANCNTQNIVAQGPPQVDIDSGQYTGCVINAWCKLPAPGPSSATTIFSLNIGTYCAVVTVSKSGNPSQTTIISRGFNTCSANAPLRIERALQVSY